MSPPPTLFPSPYTFPTLTLSLAEARETQEALLARAASIAQGRRRVQPREDMEEELTSDEEDVEDSPMDLLNNGVVFRGPEDITFSKDFTSHLAKWDKQDDGLISKMLCCAFCGQCELGGEVVSKTNGFAAIPPPPWANGAAQQMPPYSLSYPHLKDHMQTPDGKMWYRCSRCKEEGQRTKRMKRVIQLYPQYLGRLLCLHFLHAQMLSLIDYTSATSTTTVAPSPAASVRHAGPLHRHPPPPG